MLGKKLAIDAGTCSVRLHVKGEQQVVVEPALVTVDDGGTRVLGAGTAAAPAHASAPQDSTVVSPLHDGALGDLFAVEALLQHVINRGIGRQRIFKPDLMLAVMSAMSGRDRRALMEIAVRTGARTTYLIDAPLAAATGAGLPVTTAHGHMVVDAGAGKTDVAVVALESVIVGRCLRRGGRHIDAAVARHVAEAQGVMIDAATAEDVKVEIGAAQSLPEERRLLVRGIDRDSGEPTEVSVSSTDVGEVVRDQLTDLGATLRDVMAETPPSRRRAAHRRRGAAARARPLRQRRHRSAGPHRG